MNVVCDAPGSERSHGYTDDGEHIWYWLIDHRSNDLSFRKTGTPTGHPIRSSGVPERIRNATERWADTNVRGYNRETASNGGENAY